MASEPLESATSLSNAMASNQEPYNEDNYYAAYKTVRNRFRRYEPFSVLDSCIRYLYSPTKDDLSQLRKNPWLVLLLVKWIFIDEQIFTAGKKPPSNNEVHHLLQAVHNMASSLRMPSQYSHYTLFFRNIAYQQFLYQRPFNMSNLARQEIMFCSLDDGHTFRRNFYEVTGLDIGEFLTLGVMLVTCFLQKNVHSVNAEWFSPVFGTVGADKVHKFLECLSTPAEELHSFLSNSSQQQRRANEYFEQTPFIAHPLIRVRSQYICTYPNILFRALEHFAYDVLREQDAPVFMSKFGSIFEGYVQKALEYSETQFIAEETLKKELGNGGLLVDFIIAEDDANIFIDAKAVEMASKGKTTHSAEILKDRIKVSVLKAIEQAHGVNTRLLTAKSNHPVVKRRTRNYLIVVTYKELYLGNGKTLYEAVARDKIDEIVSKFPVEARIPLENMYFITVDELDLFAHGVKVGGIGFVAGLERAKRDDSQPQTRKFDFLLHLRDWGIVEPPKYVQQAFDGLYEKATDALEKMPID